MAFGTDPGTSTIPPPVTVSVDVGTVSIDGTDWQEVNVDGGGEWGTYRIRSRYEKEHHRYMMPIASPDGFQGASVAFVQLAAPTLLWICDWEASRWRNSPSIPDPELNDPNWILLDDHWNPAEVKEGQGGDLPFYSIRGRYVYGHVNPAAKTNQNVQYPRPPWLSSGIDLSVPDKSLEQGIIDVNKGQVLQMGIPRPGS